MAVRGEEVASSIDAHVREAIDRMVAEIRSSVEDVRVVVDSQLKAALQSVQADVNSLTFLPHVRKAIGELEESIEAARPPVAAAAGGSDASRVKRAVQNVERGKSQVDVLNSLLDQSLEFGSRAALLILKGETFSGWKGAGFSVHGGNDEAIKRFNAAPGLIPELDRVLRNEQVVEWDGANLASRLSPGGTSVRAVLVPMVIKDKVAAAVYVDALENDTTKFDSSAIELLVFTTGLLIDTLAIRKKIPSPSLSGGEALAPAPAPQAAPAPATRPQAAAPAPAPAPTPAPAPRPTPPPAAPAPQPAAPEEASQTVAISAAQLREMMAAQRPSFNMPSEEDFGGGGTATPAAPPSTSTARIPSIEMPMPKGVTPPPAAAPAAPSEDRPSTQFIPPPGMARGGALGGPPNEDAKRHDEARRFARLLVSEIKLYNESKVEQGRKNKDLYDRLKEDIDRSRQMYDERIAEDVRKTSNYFYDELVRILADGRAESLGL
jgi:hypothetical protein